MAKRYYIKGVSIILMVLFLYTGISKLDDHLIFKMALDESPLINQYSLVLSYVVPVIEIVLAMMLFIPKLRLAGLYISFALLAIFTLYVVNLLYTDKSAPCSCGGIIGLLDWNEHLFLNIGLTILTAIACYLSPKTNSNEKRFQNA